LELEGPNRGVWPPHRPRVFKINPLEDGRVEGLRGAIIRRIADEQTMLGRTGQGEPSLRANLNRNSRRWVCNPQCKRDNKEYGKSRQGGHERINDKKTWPYFRIIPVHKFHFERISRAKYDLCRTKTFKCINFRFSATFIDAP